jgi:hypothetical protein
VIVSISPSPQIESVSRRVQAEVSEVFQAKAAAV